MGIDNLRYLETRACLRFKMRQYSEDGLSIVRKSYVAMGLL
jgi:hypothetical protein